jgi:hypothetical protein
MRGESVERYVLFLGRPWSLHPHPNPLPAGEGIRENLLLTRFLSMYELT